MTDSLQKIFSSEVLFLRDKYKNYKLEEIRMKKQYKEVKKGVW